MAEIDKRLNNSPGSPIQGHTLLNLSKVEENYFVTFDDSLPLGEANASLEKALTNLSTDASKLNFEVFVPTRAVRETISRAQQDKEAIVRAQINVYGPKEAACSVGREFSTNKIYLQRPDYIKGGISYENPHMLKIFDYSPSHFNVENDANETSSTDVPEASFKDNIADVYSSLTRNQNLKGLEADERLRTPLLE